MCKENSDIPIVFFNKKSTIAILNNHVKAHEMKVIIQYELV